MAALLRSGKAGDRAGEEDRFSALYVERYRPVLAYCARRTSDEADAMDATAEVFVIAWRRRRDVPDEPLPWLYGVARRVLANQRRGDQRRSLLHERLQSLPSPSATEAAPTESPVAAAFALLSDADRELLALAAWEELAPREIAQVLEVPVSVVSVRLHRAKKRLRTSLEIDVSNSQGPVLSRTKTAGETK